MEKRQRVDILIAAYNVRDYIEKAVISALNQTYGNVRVIVGDDQSTDGTLEVLRGLAAQYDNIVLMELEHGGLMNVRDKTISAADSPLVMFLDGDDYLTPDAVESLYNCMVEKELDIAVGGYYRQSPSYTIEIVEPLRETMQGRDYLLKVLTNQVTSFLCMRLYKREMLEGLFYPLEIWHSEDKISNLQIITLHNPKIGYLDKPIYYYVKRTDSLAHMVMSLDYVKTVTGVIERVCKDVPNIKPYLVSMRVGFFLMNINSSKSPNVLNDDWVKQLYNDLRDDDVKVIIKKTIRLSDRVHLLLYKHSATHWLAYIIKAFNRIFKSIKKRINNKLEH